jgi:two-component system sensor histidine kinase QseC
MSLQRRLLLYLLVCAPLVWGLALYFSISRARHEVNELFDTELIRLARQVHSTLGPAYPAAPVPLPPAPAEGSKDAGESDLRDLAVAVWDAQGRLMLSDREGAELPHRIGASGFLDETVEGRLWRVYYLPSIDGKWLVAAGQGAYERDELVYGLTVTQVVPWLLVLPFLLAVMAWAVRRALWPMHQLTAQLAERKAEDLRSVPDDRAPAELKPLLSAMNGLFARIEQLLVRERRFTADAAHEMRTPLAVLRAQWDVVRRSTNPVERAEAEAKLGAGLDRMGRLVTQMLSLSRVESGVVATLATEVQWRPIVEQAMSDCLALAERRRIDLACEWPARGTHPMPLLGDAHLLTIMLRNLLDNAVRYAPPGTAVVLRIGREHLEVENGGPPLSPGQLARLGERFYRPDGQQEGGSGLGISIVRRIAELHGLELIFGTGVDGQGVKVILQFDPAHR